MGLEARSFLLFLLFRMALNRWNLWGDRAVNRSDGMGWPLMANIIHIACGIRRGHTRYRRGAVLCWEVLGGLVVSYKKGQCEGIALSLGSAQLKTN